MDMYFYPGSGSIKSRCNGGEGKRKRETTYVKKVQVNPQSGPIDVASPCNVVQSSGPLPRGLRWWVQFPAQLTSSQIYTYPFAMSASTFRK
jgi:hypothetical protein